MSKNIDIRVCGGGGGSTVKITGFRKAIFSTFFFWFFSEKCFFITDTPPLFQNHFWHTIWGGKNPEKFFFWNVEKMCLAKLSTFDSWSSSLLSSLSLSSSKSSLALLSLLLFSCWSSWRFKEQQSLHSNSPFFWICFYRWDRFFCVICRTLFFFRA